MCCRQLPAVCNYGRRRQAQVWRLQRNDGEGSVLCRRDALQRSVMSGAVVAGGSMDNLNMGPQVSEELVKACKTIVAEFGDNMVRVRLLTTLSPPVPLPLCSSSSSSCSSCSSRSSSSSSRRRRRKKRSRRGRRKMPSFFFCST